MGERDGQPAPQRSHQILIVGGGTAGITVAARLRRARAGLDIAIVEPSAKHYYQPLWTLVGAGVVKKEVSERDQQPLIPPGVTWIRSSVEAFDPERNRVVTTRGEQLRYEWLVACPGIQLNWDGVKGLAQSLGRDGVCSNYAYEQCERTWDTIRSFKGGTALFTMPPPPIKCAGAPQKIMYLADDYFRRSGVRDKTKIVYVAGTPSIFSVKEFAATLDRVCARKDIERHFKHKLVELSPERREARFVHTETQEEMRISYDMIHVTPPQGAPDVVKKSPLADAAGWVEVDKHTTRHTRFPNVFAIGRREQPPDLAHRRGDPQAGAGAGGEPARGAGPARRERALRRLRGLPDPHRLREAREAAALRVRLRPEAHALDPAARHDEGAAPALSAQALRLASALLARDAARPGLSGAAPLDIRDGLCDAIGNTPLIRLRKASELTGCTILGKAEFTNPGGSVKDRAALYIIREAERSGALRPGGLIVEGTAGNTGIGLALVGNAKGYRTLIVIPETQSQEKKDALRLCGATLREVPAVPFKDPNNYVKVAERLAGELAAREPQGVLYANQWDNLANRDAHEQGTGPEIWRQTEGRIDGFVCAIGTGGTLAGVAAFLKRQRPSIQVAAADPEGAAMYEWFTHGELKSEGSSITEGIGQGRITGNLKGLRVDCAYRVPDAEALPVLFDLLAEEGLCLGGSSGINVAGAIRLARDLGPGKTIVTILADSGARYQSKLWNPAFLRGKGLPVPAWLVGDGDVRLRSLRG